MHLSRIPIIFKSRLFLKMWMIYSLFIIYGTTIPFNLIRSDNEFFDNIHNINKVLFMDNEGKRASIPDIVQNILFFIPFGFFGIYSLHKRYRKILIIALTGFLLSLFVETLQLFTVDRTTSINDLIMNTGGTVTGAVLALIFFRSYPLIISNSKIRNLLSSRFAFPLIVACIVMAVGSMEPFDFTLDIGIIWSKVKALYLNQDGFTGILTDEPVVFLRTFLFGIILCLYSMNIQLKHPAVIASSAGVLFCILMESSQIIIESRAATIYDMSIMIAGCLCGVIYTLTSSRSLTSRCNSNIIIIMTAATAMVYSLTPFQISQSYNKMSLIPFLPYYEQTSFNALSNFIETVLIYFPMGCIIAVFHINKEEALMISGITAFLIAMPLELLQGWIVGRYPDVTNVIGAIGGAVIGGLIWINGLTSWKKNFLYKNS